ncbi:MAG: penicillin-insensitive murein endopeptidase [Deltaproteobacteria bacterium]|nr:penicillin-insensitive murein endopeptidase [Deltaproteobacteria bacterium]
MLLLALVSAQACTAAIKETRLVPDLPVETLAPPPEHPVTDDVDRTVSSDPTMRRLSFISTRARPVTLHYRQRSQSVGTPTKGRLENGRCLPSRGPGFVVFSKNRCGTDESAVLLMFAIQEVMEGYPGSPPVVIGSLSRPEGGRLKPHRSHCSGRDVDVGFFASDGRRLQHFADLGAHGIDYDKSFYMMASLMATGRVMYIFVNYSLQPHLYEAARRMGYDEEQLKYIMQYPRPRGEKAGIIRHARGHKRHFHVRFACPDGNATCVD